MKVTSERDLPMMSEPFNPTVEPTHDCEICGFTYHCLSPKDDDCDCGIYCDRCEEARQETPA